MNFPSAQAAFADLAGSAEAQTAQEIKQFGRDGVAAALTSQNRGQAQVAEIGLFHPDETDATDAIRSARIPQKRGKAQIAEAGDSHPDHPEAVRSAHALEEFLDPGLQDFVLLLDGPFKQLHGMRAHDLPAAPQLEAAIANLGPEFQAGLELLPENALEDVELGDQGIGFLPLDQLEGALPVAHEAGRFRQILELGLHHAGDDVQVPQVHRHVAHGPDSVLEPVARSVPIAVFLGRLFQFHQHGSGLNHELCHERFPPKCL